MNNFELLQQQELADKWLTLNSKLQNKKNALRKELQEKGVQEKDKCNKYDNYTYFSEAAYKKLFTDLFSKHNLELKFNEMEYRTYSIENSKLPNGRIVKLEFTLIDIETGFFETTIISAEANDRSDKGGYKAYTGALKYYLANTFMVATGEEPETDNSKDEICKVCGKKIEAVKGHSAEEVIALGIKKFNQKMCYNCIHNKIEERKQKK